MKQTDHVIHLTKSFKKININAFVSSLLALLLGH
jgi:hypothetical protein